MDGSVVYEKKFIDMAHNVINKNKEKKCLSGFYNFIGKLSRSSAFNYVYYVAAFLDYCQKKPQDLVLDDYTEYLSSLYGTTSSYQIAIYAALKKFSKYAVAAQISQVDYMLYIDRPKAKETKETKQKRSKGFLRQDEVQTYLLSAKYGAGSNMAISRQKEWRERDLAIILLLLTTGMRCSALYKLDLDSLDLNNKTVVTVEKGEVTQTFYLSDEVIKVLVQWLDKRKVFLGSIKEDALFISNQRTRLTQKSISRITNKYGMDIEGKKLSPHKLRATYGTQLYDATKDLYLVQQCMGHKSPQITEIYIRGQEEGNRKLATDIMNNLISKNLM